MVRQKIILSDKMSYMPVRRARQFLDRYWDGHLPVDVINIARACGITVISDSHYLQALDLSGMIDWANDSPTITYNGLDPAVRQRFTIAHELGHFALNHGTSFRDSPAKFSLVQHDSKEIAANQFAAELLMPEDAITHAITAKNLYNVAKLANLFMVSQVAMKFRLKNLGWAQ